MSVNDRGKHEVIIITLRCHKLNYLISHFLRYNLEQVIIDLQQMLLFKPQAGRLKEMVGLMEGGMDEQMEGQDGALGSRQETPTDSWPLVVVCWRVVGERLVVWCWVKLFTVTMNSESDYCTVSSTARLTRYMFLVKSSVETFCGWIVFLLKVILSSFSYWRTSVKQTGCLTAASVGLLVVWHSLHLYFSNMSP